MFTISTWPPAWGMHQPLFADIDVRALQTPRCKGLGLANCPAKNEP
jgi:hypothetical protein